MVEYIKIAVFFSIGVYIYERIDIAFALIFLLSLIMVLTVVSVFKHKFNTKILVMMTALVMGTVNNRLHWTSTPTPSIRTKKQQVRSCRAAWKSEHQKSPTHGLELCVGDSLDGACDLKQLAD